MLVQKCDIFIFYSFFSILYTNYSQQVKRHQQQQQQQELLQSSQTDEPMVQLTDQPHASVMEGPAAASWSPIKNPFKVPTVEQTQEAVYSLLQLTDFWGAH